MTVPERIAIFLEGGKPGAFCDDCISKGLSLRRRQQAASVTLALSSSPGFQRGMGDCSSRDHVGSRQKLVVRAR